MSLKLLSLLYGLILLVVLTGCAVKASAEKQKIPYTDGYATDEWSVSSYSGIGDHYESPYFKHPHVFHMQSTDNLSLLSNFYTYQQMNGFHCGPAVVLMVLYYYGESDYEFLICEAMGIHKDVNGSNHGEPTAVDECREIGASTEMIAGYFEDKGWDVISSIDEGVFNGSATFENPLDFRGWVIRNLQDGIPIMVEWPDWSGHWKIIIGYDTMGTEYFGDDVLIFADPYDTSDHYQDGYFLFNAECFFYIWSNEVCLSVGENIQQWVIAKPK